VEARSAVTDKKQILWLGTLGVIAIVAVTLRSPVSDQAFEPALIELDPIQSAVAILEPTSELARLTWAGRTTVIISTPSSSQQIESVPSLAEELEPILALEDSEEREQALTRLLQQWIAHDALAAARFAQTLEPADLRQDILLRVMQLWAVHDNRAALSWAAQLSDATEREAAMFRVCAHVSGSDPLEAIRLAIDHHDLVPNGLLENLTAHWAAQDLAGAYEWVSQHPSGEQRNKLMARVVFEHSRVDSAAAARLAVEQIPSGPAQTEAAISVLHQWALTDLSGASGWAESFPEGPLRERAQNEIAGIVGYRGASSLQ
jgi:hypothetical protein